MSAVLTAKEQILQIYNSSLPRLEKRTRIARLTNNLSPSADTPDIRSFAVGCLLDLNTTGLETDPMFQRAAPSEVALARLYVRGKYPKS